MLYIKPLIAFVPFTFFCLVCHCNIFLLGLIRYLFTVSILSFWNNNTTHFWYYFPPGSENACEKTSFAFLRQELPVRLANIMKEINLLPDNLLRTPSVRLVQSWYAGFMLFSFSSVISQISLHIDSNVFVFSYAGICKVFRRFLSSETKMQMMRKSHMSKFIQTYTLLFNFLNWIQKLVWSSWYVFIVVSQTQW